MAVIDIVLANIVGLLILYFTYQNYKDNGVVKEVIDGFTKWVKTGNLK